MVGPSGNNYPFTAKRQKKADLPGPEAHVGL
jgi:hypothetical protein